MILHSKCPVCGKKAIEKSNKTIAGLKFIVLECGHNITSVPTKADDISLTSEEGLKPYPYQVEGAKFVIEESSGRALICDEMGLGKTIQAMMVAKFLYDHNPNHKFLAVLRSGLRMQWFKEFQRWCGEDWMIQILEQEDQFVFSKAKGYIISIDLLYRFKDIDKWIERLGVELIILDECQSIMNHESKRTNCVRQICKSVPKVIALSGTPIKNHAGEYFPILNILHPEKFPSLINYQRKWVDTYWDVNSGKYKYGGIRDPKEFKEFTSDFILRRTREDVNDQILLACGNKPKRDWRFSELGKAVEQAYRATMDEFTDYYLYSNDSEFQRSSNILAYMSKMRHLTGLAKIESVVNFIEDFILETDRKFVLFCHHEDVMDLIAKKLEKVRQEWPTEFGAKICQIRSHMDMMERERQVEEFKGGSRIMIASTLASSEGLNLQFCSDYGMMERQWNPANEEQAEARFIRIGQKATIVNGTYFIATGTIDEFFSELVEKKRSIMANTLDGAEYKWEESSLMKELADTLARQNMQRFKL